MSQKLKDMKAHTGLIEKKHHYVNQFGGEPSWKYEQKYISKGLNKNVVPFFHYYFLKSSAMQGWERAIYTKLVKLTRTLTK